MKSFLISHLLLIPGFILVQGGNPKGSFRKVRRNVQEIYSIQTSPDRQKEVLGVDQNNEKLDKNFDRRKRRQEKKKADKEKCQREGNCEKQPVSKEPANEPTWSPTASPVPTITSFPTREPIPIFSVPSSETTSTPQSSSSGAQIFTAQPVSPGLPTTTPSTISFSIPTGESQGVPGTPTTLTFTAAPVIPTFAPQRTFAPFLNIIGSPAERPISAGSPLDNNKYESSSSPPSAEPSDSVTDEPTVFITEEPSAVITEQPSVIGTTDSPSQNMPVVDNTEISSEEDELQLDLACEGLESGIIFTTDHYIDVAYIYELLITTSSTLQTVSESIDEKVQSSMSQNFIPCDSRRRRLQTLGVSMGEARSTGSCTFFDVADTIEDDQCFSMQGSVKLYFSRESEMTRELASNMIFEYFVQNFNDGSNPSRSLQSNSNFIDAELGILGIYFSGLIGEEGNLITDQSSFSAAKRTQGATNVENPGINGLSIGLIVAAGGCAFLIAVVVVVRFRGRTRRYRRKYGVELSDSEDECSENGKLRVLETQDTLESGISKMASFYDIKCENKNETEKKSHVFMNKNGEVFSAATDFTKERPYLVSDTVDL